MQQLLSLRQPQGGQAVGRGVVKESSARRGAAAWAIWPRSRTSACCVSGKAKLDMLLDQDEGAGAFLGHAGDGPRQARRRRSAPNPRERLVEQQQRRIGQERPRDRQHLLLAARRAGCPKLRRRSAKAGEEIGSYTAGISQRPARAATVRVLLHHRQRGKRSRAPLRHPADAGKRAAMRRQRGDVLPAPEDGGRG